MDVEAVIIGDIQILRCITHDDTFELIIEPFETEYTLNINRYGVDDIPYQYVFKFNDYDHSELYLYDINDAASVVRALETLDAEAEGYTD